MDSENKEDNKNSGNPDLQKDSKTDEKGKTEVKNASASGLGSIQRPDGEKEKPDKKNY